MGGDFGKQLFPKISPQRLGFPSKLEALNFDKLGGISPSSWLFDKLRDNNGGRLRGGIGPKNWLFSRCNSISYGS